MEVCRFEEQKSNHLITEDKQSFNKIHKKQKNLINLNQTSFQKVVIPLLNLPAPPAKTRKLKIQNSRQTLLGVRGRLKKLNMGNE